MDWPEVTIAFHILFPSFSIGLAAYVAPPPEIAATGHQRCIISLKEQYVDAWLDPASIPKECLDQILSDREAPYYEHQIAA